MQQHNRKTGRSSDSTPHMLRTIRRQMSMIAHYQGDLHDASVKHGRKHKEARTCHMNDIRLEILNNLGAFHFWQVDCKTDMIVQWKGEALCVADGKALMLSRQIFNGCFAVDGENIDFVARLFQEFEHLLEAIGITGDAGSQWKKDKRFRFRKKVLATFPMQMAKLPEISKVRARPQK